MPRSESSKALVLALRNPPPPGQLRNRGVVRSRNDTPGPDDIDGGAGEEGRDGKRQRGDSPGIQQSAGEAAGMHHVPGGSGQDVEPWQLAWRLEQCGSFRELQVNLQP